MAREISVRRLAAAIALAPALLAAPTASAQSGLGQIETGEAAGRYQIVRMKNKFADWKRAFDTKGRKARCFPNIHINVKFTAVNCPPIIAEIQVTHGS